MRVRIEPFAYEDLAQLEVQERHAELVPVLRRHGDTVRELTEGPYSYTAWSVYGRPLCACGILRTPADTGYAWAFLGPDMRRAMVPVTRYVAAVLDRFIREVGPVLAEIDESNPQAVRWVEMLGFTRAREGLWVCE